MAQDLDELKQFSVSPRAKIEEQEEQLSLHGDAIKKLSKSNKDLEKHRTNRNSLDAFRKCCVADRNKLRANDKTISFLHKDKAELESMKMKNLVTPSLLCL